jgi:hypothetical protein
LIGERERESIIGERESIIGERERERFTKINEIHY